MTLTTDYEFFPCSVREQLPALYSTEGQKDPMVMRKFFHPLASLTWYAIECGEVDEDSLCDTDKPKVDTLFFGWVFNHDLSELGYWSLSMMEAVEVMGLRIERDINFKPTPLSVVKSWYMERVL